MTKINNYLESRNAHSDENAEDYLELINDLLNDRGEARVVDIAKQLGIAQSTANKTIQRLQKQGYIKKLPYRSIFLTAKGLTIAYRAKKRHNTVYNFLIKLGVNKKIAKKDAEGIEHHVSGETLKKLKKFNYNQKSTKNAEK